MTIERTRLEAEVNNLLAVIMGRSRILRRRPEEDESVARGLDLIRRTGERVAALTEHLRARRVREVLK